MAKKYLVRDPEDMDRVYTKAVHGFDFVLEHGKVEEVNEDEMGLLKKASPFLAFEEMKEKEDMVFGVPKGKLGVLKKKGKNK